MKTTSTGKNVSISILLQIESLIQAGDGNKALNIWSESMKNLSELFKTELDRGSIRANFTVIAMVSCTARLFPKTQEFASVQLVCANLIELLLELPHGNVKHPLANTRGRKIPGLMKGSELKYEALHSEALACWLFLEKWNHPAPVRVIRDALRQGGYDRAESTLRSWRYRAGERLFIRDSPVRILEDIESGAAKHRVMCSDDAVRYVSLKLTQLTEMTVLR